MAFAVGNAYVIEPTCDPYAYIASGDIVFDSVNAITERFTPDIIRHLNLGLGTYGMNGSRCLNGDSIAQSLANAFTHRLRVFDSLTNEFTIVIFTFLVETRTFAVFHKEHMIARFIPARENTPNCYDFLSIVSEITDMFLTGTWFIY